MAKSSIQKKVYSEVRLNVEKIEIFEKRIKSHSSTSSKVYLPKHCEGKRALIMVIK
jgi:putative transposon-encoded protein